MKKINIIASSDLHGFINGVKDTASYVDSIKQLKELYPNAIFLDNGDYFIGSLETTFFNNSNVENPLVTSANESFDLMNAGNHDFDYGLDKLIEYSKMLNIPYICSNVLDLNYKPIFEPYKIIERNGIKIGFLGIITSNLSQLTYFANVKNIRILSAPKALENYAKKVREKSDIFIVLYHGGIERDPNSGQFTQYDTKEDEAYALMNTNYGIDGFIFGHQHRSSCGKLNGIAYAQADFAGQAFGYLEFKIDEINKQILESKANIIKADKKKDLIYKSTNFDQWLESNLDLNRLEDFLKEHFTFDFLYFKGNISTIRDFYDSFSQPCQMSIYTFTIDEIKKLGLPYKGSKKIVKVISNDTNLPYDRIKERSVLNIFDMYIKYINEYN